MQRWFGLAFENRSEMTARAILFRQSWVQVQTSTHPSTSRHHISSSHNMQGPPATNNKPTAKQFPHVKCEVIHSLLSMHLQTFEQDDVKIWQFAWQITKCQHSSILSSKRNNTSRATVKHHETAAHQGVKIIIY